MTTTSVESVETRDASTRWILWATVALVATLVGGGGGIGLFYFKGIHKEMIEAPNYREDVVSGLPSLQKDPVHLLVEQRAKETKILNSYAWIDQSHTRARIPIERALELIAKKHLIRDSGDVNAH